MSEKITFVEIDINYCSLEYGVAPCTAELGVTGNEKCFNTRNSCSDCQDIPNFSESTKTLRFAKPSSLIPSSVDAIQSIKSIGVTTPVIKSGEDLGERMTASISFSNHPHSDAGIDKYYLERAYDSYESGTFWGKFKARNSYVEGQPIRIIQGEPTTPISEMKTYNLIIDNFEGPDSGGNFSIKAVDIFRFLDDSKAQAPAPSGGYLSANISDSQTTFTLAPSGIGDFEYPASGFLSIGKEYMSYTRSGDVFTVVRGLENSQAKEHKAEAAVQLALTYTSETVQDIIYDLMINYSEVSPDLITLPDWDEEINLSAGYLFDAIIPKPTSVKTLLTELIKQANLVIWPDSIDKQIRLKILRPVAPTAKCIDDNYIIDGSFSQKEQLEKRVSQSWIFYNLQTPFETLKEEQSYKNILVTLGQNSDQQKNARYK